MSKVETICYPILCEIKATLRYWEEWSRSDSALWDLHDCVWTAGFFSIPSFYDFLPGVAFYFIVEKNTSALPLSLPCGWESCHKCEHVLPWVHLTHATAGTYPTVINSPLNYCMLFFQQIPTFFFSGYKHHAKLLDAWFQLSTGKQIT